MGTKLAYTEFVKNSKYKNKEIYKFLNKEYGLEKYIKEHLEMHLKSSLEEFENFNNKEKKSEIEKLVRHSKYVLEIANYMICKYYFFLSGKDTELVLIATLLHDICKFEEDDKHHKLGAEYVIKNKIYEDDESNQLLSDIIKYHKKGKGKGIKKAELLLCNIVHDADKISKIYKKKTWRNGNEKFKENHLENQLAEIEDKLKLSTSYVIFNEYKNEIDYFTKNY